MLNLRIFGLEFENTIVIFEISVLKYILLQSLVQKLKSLNLGQKMSDLGVFGLESEKKISYLKSAASTLSNCKIF